MKFQPPIKCQGRKTSIIESISTLSKRFEYKKFIEPFCGSCSVAFNILPSQALLCDTNIHIIEFYNNLKNKKIEINDIVNFLWMHGQVLKNVENYFYEARYAFNEMQSCPERSMYFLFLNRSCFNGLMRFNSKGEFNTPFCKVPDRFNESMLAKIRSQLEKTLAAIQNMDVEFRVQGFTDTILDTNEHDLIYADPPYLGRNTTYFNSWTEKDDSELSKLLTSERKQFILSTWFSDPRGLNPYIEKHWSNLSIEKIDHHYRIGPKVENRFKMIEALIFRIIREKEGVLSYA